MDYFDEGFAVREPSWHAKETLLQEAPTLDNWRQAAGLTWEPVKIPLALPGGQPSGTFILARSDRLELLADPDPVERDKAILNRGTTDAYVPIEHERDMEPLLAELFNAARLLGVTAEFTTAGSVKNGQEVYACLKLSKPIQIKGDPSLSLPYGVILNGHNGAAARGGLTMVRVVCANTYGLADAELDQSAMSFKISHAGDVESRLETARKAIAGWLDAVEGYRQQMDYLSELTVDDALVADWLDEFLPVDERRMTERQVVRRREERVNFHRLYEGGDHGGATTDGIRGTGYGLWMTTVEYMDHFVPWRSPDTYLRRTMLKPVDAKARAADRIAELVQQH